MRKIRGITRPPRTRNRSVPPPPAFDIATLPDDAVLRAQELAGWLRLSLATLEAWRYQHPDRGPPWVVVAGLPRYRLGDVRKWLLSDQCTGRRRSSRSPVRLDAPAIDQ